MIRAMMMERGGSAYSKERLCGGGGEIFNEFRTVLIQVCGYDHEGLQGCLLHLHRGVTGASRYILFKVGDEMRN